MKKLLTTTSTLLLLGAYLLAQQSFDYTGIPDDTHWTNTENYIDFTMRTTLGYLARYSDIVGIGQVTNREDDHLTVTVDHALVGCTNGASIVMYETPFIEWAGGRGLKANYMPTNNSRIVFAAFTNDYDGSLKIYWNSPQIPHPPARIQAQYELRYLNRSWWYPERDDGMLLAQFTNVLQAVRFDRNWTNFFYLCRDGANSTSNRVREDSYYDMRHLAMFSTQERMQIILDDPLVDSSHKTLLLKEGWKTIVPDP